MAAKKILTIFGATGQQGGSVLDLVLARPALTSKYALRAITRDPASAKAQALASKGVEVVRGDLDDLPSLTAALKDSYGVFGNTDFWSHLSKEREIQQGKNIFDAAQQTGVRHFIYSALDDVSALSHGRHTHVAHFDGKAAVAAYAKERKQPGMIVTIFKPAMYIDFLKMAFRKAPDGTPTLSLPFPDENVPWPLLEARRDTGKYVVGLFEAGEAADGAEVQGVSAWTTPRKVVDAFSQYLGKEAKYQAVSGEAIGHAFPEAVRTELVDMLLWIGEDSYYGKGTEQKQAESDRFLVEDADLLDVPGWIKAAAPWDL